MMIKTQRKVLKKAVHQSAHFPDLLSPAQQQNYQRFTQNEQNNNYIIT